MAAALKHPFGIMRHVRIWLTCLLLGGSSMWLMFLFAMMAFFVMIYLPGYLVCRCLTSDYIRALSLAPLFSTCAYPVLGIVYSKMGIRCSWVLLMVPMVLVGSVCMMLWRRGEATVSDQSAQSCRNASSVRRELVHELSVYLPYIVFGALICLRFFVKQLDGPESFTWRTDNTFHLNLIARFVRTGEWSMLRTSLYENLSQASVDGSYYYPAGWHVLVSMVSSAFGVSAPFAANVANAVFIAFTIPTSAYILMKTVFPDKPLAMRLGAWLPLAFGVFPWHIIIPEAKQPFFYGLVLAPSCMAAFIVACEDALDGRPSLRDVASVLISLLACALAHPCCVFSVGVLLVPYIMWAIWRAVDARTTLRFAHFLSEIGFLAFVAGAWTFAFNIHAIHEMTLWMHPAYTTRAAAVLRVVFMGFKDVSPQPYLAVLVWLGVAYSLYRRRYLWMSCSFLAFGMFYVIDASTDQFIKRVVSGFWYTDFNRLAASAVIMAVPLATLGLYVVVRVVQHLFLAVTSAIDENARRFCEVGLPLLGAVVFAAAIFCPSYHLPQMEVGVKTAFGYTVSQARAYNSVKKNILTPEERRFIDSAHEVAGDDLIINFPLDGSAYAYALDGLNTYMRRYNYTYMNEDSRYLAAHLYALATDAQSREIIDRIDAKYVLLLDMDEYASEESTIYENGYSAKRWAGMTRLDDDTPGFEIVLSKGDMRLYRIVDQAA